VKIKDVYVVALGDTDATGAIYYANYLYIFDKARISLYNAAGLDLRVFYKMRAVAAYVEFKNVVTFGDVLEIYSWFCKIGNSSVKMCHEVYREDSLVARGYVVDVYTENGRSAPLPPDVREKMSALQGEDIFVIH